MSACRHLHASQFAEISNGVSVEVLDGGRMRCLDCGEIYTESLTQSPYAELESQVAALTRERDSLREALRGTSNGAKQFTGQLCWCRTIANLYCVGQPQCIEARATLATPATTEDKHDG